MLLSVCTRWGSGSDRCILPYEHLGPCKDAQGNTTLTAAAGLRAYVVGIHDAASGWAEQSGRCYECGLRGHTHWVCPGPPEILLAVPEPRYVWDGLERMTADRLREMQRRKR